MTPTLHTLTGNLLGERTFTFDAWEAGRTQRAREQFFQVGGKGLNVARMLVRLGARTSALCFPGGATGTECLEWLRARGVDVQAFPMAAPTRAGLVVRGPGHPETTFLGPDAPIEAAAAKACARHLDAQPAGDVLAICGSVPGWSGADCEALRAAIESWLRRGPVVADSYGPPLDWLVQRPLAWVKINRVEFDGLFPPGDRDRPLADRLAGALDRWPVSAWIVTDGSRPLWYVERGGPPRRLDPPEIAEVSATGSGDVLHAVLLYAIFWQAQPISRALELALPYAAANAAHPSVADFPLNNLPSLRSTA